MTGATLTRTLLAAVVLDVVLVMAGLALAGCENDKIVTCPTSPSCTQSRPASWLYQPDWTCKCVMPAVTP